MRARPLLEETVAKRKLTIKGQRNYANRMLSQITRLQGQYEKALQQKDLLPPEMPVEDVESALIDLARMRATWEKRLADLGEEP
jgi:hypothetical protein